MNDFAHTMPGTKQPVRPLISTRSCFELGLCQQRRPACLDCDHDSAWKTRQEPDPGVEGPFRPKPLASRLGQWLAHLWRRHWVVLAVWGCVAAAMAWCVVLTSLVIGYAHRRNADFSWPQLMQAGEAAWAAVWAIAGRL